MTKKLEMIMFNNCSCSKKPTVHRMTKTAKKHCKTHAKQKIHVTYSDIRKCWSQIMLKNRENLYGKPDMLQVKNQPFGRKGELLCRSKSKQRMESIIHFTQFARQSVNVSHPLKKCHSVARLWVVLSPPHPTPTE